MALRATGQPTPITCWIDDTGPSVQPGPPSPPTSANFPHGSIELPVSCPRLGAHTADTPWAPRSDWRGHAIAPPDHRPGHPSWNHVSPVPPSPPWATLMQSTRSLTLPAISRADLAPSTLTSPPYAQRPTLGSRWATVDKLGQWTPTPPNDAMAKFGCANRVGLKNHHLLADSALVTFAIAPHPASVRLRRHPFRRPTSGRRSGWNSVPPIIRPHSDTLCQSGALRAPIGATGLHPDPPFQHHGSQFIDHVCPRTPSCASSIYCPTSTRRL